MKLYLISQSVNKGYSTYDSAIVSAESPQDARNIHPDTENVTHVKEGKWMTTEWDGKKYEEEYNHTWVDYSDIGQIQTEYLGETDRERGVILASFNAG